MLGGWDLRTDEANTAAALGVLVSVKCIGLDTHAGDPWLMDPKEAVLASAKDLMAHYGRLDVPWGTINRLRRGDVDVPIAGGPDILRAVYSAGHDLEDDGTLTAVAGDTYIAIVAWDAKGNMSARTRHQFGSATLDKSSAHYADQAALFAAQKLRVFPFSDEALSRETESVSHIGGAQ